MTHRRQKQLQQFRTMTFSCVGDLGRLMAAYHGTRSRSRVYRPSPRADASIRSSRGHSRNQRCPSVCTGLQSTQRPRTPRGCAEAETSSRSHSRNQRRQSVCAYLHSPQLLRTSRGCAEAEENTLYQTVASSDALPMTIRAVPALGLGRCLAAPSRSQHRRLQGLTGRELAAAHPWSWPCRT